MLDERTNGHKEKVKLLLADAHSLFRASLRDQLQSTSRFTIVAEAASGAEIMDLIEKKSPDIVLLDIGLPGLDGIACTRQIKQSHPEITVLVLSTHDDELHVMEAFDAGANGYLSKRLSGQDLIRAFETVHQECYLIPANLMTRLRGDNRKIEVANLGDSSGVVTKSELRVLSSLAQGRSNKQIAEEIFVSEKTVKNHLNHLFKKLGVKNRTEAVLKAMSRGLVAMQ